MSGWTAQSRGAGVLRARAGLLGKPRTRATALLAASVALSTLVACGNGSAADDEPGATSSSATEPSSAGSSSGAPGEGRTVAPPGELDQPLRSADILLVAFDRRPLDDDLVERVRKLPGVEATELLGVGSVSVQNQVLSVAAVDPGSYRRFTSAGQSQQIWERVAGGELALTESLAKKVADDEAFVRLGNDREAPRVHVGAYAEQVLGIDLVVNRAWGDELGMVAGNALLISTGIGSPQKVARPLRRLVDGAASVQMLDAVARYGLDPDATQTAYLTGGSVARAVGSYSYRVIGGGRIAPDPAWVTANIRTEEVPILGRVTCHRVVLPQLRAALNEVAARGLADKIHPGEYAGCYYPRFIAGSQQLSLHSFGIALDLNVPGNQRGTVGEMDRTVVSIFKKWGFAWGGDWKWTDPMHFEMNALVEAR